MFQFTIVFTAGNKAVLKILDMLYLFSVPKPGIGIIGKDQIHAAIFQKIHTAGRCLIGNFDVDIGKMGMKFPQVGHKIISADCIAGTDAQLAAV